MTGNRALEEDDTAAAIVADLEGLVDDLAIAAAEQTREADAVKNAARFFFDPAIDPRTGKLIPEHVYMSLEIRDFRLSCGCVTKLTCGVIVQRPDREWAWARVVKETETILVNMAVEQAHKPCGMHEYETRGLIADVPEESEWADVLAEDEEAWWESAAFWCRACSQGFRFGPGVEITPLFAGRSAVGVCPLCGGKAYRDRPDAAPGEE